jgi:DNA-binding CsgD family transcriptional regulator
MGGVITGPELLEREAELRVIEGAIARALEGVGSLVAIDGPAGAGKTALMQTAAAAAADAGLVVMRARGAELEREFAFGVARQIFDDYRRQGSTAMGELFGGAARFAAPVLGVEVEGAPATPSDDPFAARHGLYWLAANLQTHQAAVMLIDDAHWVDTASLAALAHLANRMEGLAIAFIIAARSEESSEQLDAVRRQARDTGDWIQLAPLGEESAAVVVRSFAPSADDSVCGACFRASGGNPFLLRELARAVQAGELDVHAGDLVVEHSPERVTRDVADRMARLPDSARRLARAAAVLGDGVPLAQVAALAGVDQHEAARAADTLVVAGVLGGTQPVEFLHPLLRAAVYDGLGPAARSVEHGRAARLLADQAASPERVAAQLLRCLPADDGWACEQLLAAAGMAAGGGAVDAAARYLRRALDEPPPPDIRSAILLQLGLMEAISSETDAAIAHLREALAAELDPGLRMRATVLLAGLLGHSFRIAEAAEAMEAQLPLLTDHPALQATAEAMFANVTRVDPTIRPRAARAIERLRARVADGGETDPAVLGTVATEMVMAGEPAESAAQVAMRALAGFDWANAGPEWSGLIAARVLVYTEHYDAATAALNQAVEAARERGSVHDVGGALAFRGELHLRMGDLGSAEVDARTLLEIATASGWPGGEGFALAWLAEVLIERGELDQAEQLFEGDGAAASNRALMRGYTTAEVLLARGRVRIAKGRAMEGIDSLRESGRWSTAVEVVNPAITPWRSLLAHALVDVGQGGEARRLAADELERARAFGAPRALATALRAAARVEGGQSAIRMLREADAVLDGSPARLERARVLTTLGAALHEAGGGLDAREPLRTAVDLAHRSGAGALEDKALDELRATGARPRRRRATGTAALTPSERRIADLAAGGQQNREIAQTLFVTTYTVEFHLRNAYRKLGITSRKELAGALRRQTSGARSGVQAPA